ncbi:MAG: hypothetical protein JSU70_07450 [Phycisphaerales bacterium]|nr:MAG: hypothetical protein JSU70_07450 [Phycisphaerales bacterium]
MNLNSPEIKSCVQALKDIDFELAYLALLACEGLKPLSRWEKPLDGEGLLLLQQLGLEARQIHRTVKTGKDVVETIFGREPGYVQIYEQRFGGRPVDKSAETQRFEGYLFGYPPCCIEQYIAKPYTPNGLPTDDQEILFHWACRDCTITPTILPAYRSLNDLASKL